MASLETVEYSRYWGRPETEYTNCWRKGERLGDIFDREIGVERYMQIVLESGEGLSAIVLPNACWIVFSPMDTLVCRILATSVMVAGGQSLWRHRKSACTYLPLVH